MTTIFTPHSGRIASHDRVALADITLKWFAACDAVQEEVADLEAGLSTSKSAARLRSGIPAHTAQLCFRSDDPT
jgi:hypothetical protein